LKSSAFLLFSLRAPCVLPLSIDIQPRSLAIQFFYRCFSRPGNIDFPPLGRPVWNLHFPSLGQILGMTPRSVSFTHGFSSSKALFPIVFFLSSYSFHPFGRCPACSLQTSAVLPLSSSSLRFCVLFGTPQRFPSLFSGDSLSRLPLPPFSMRSAGAKYRSPTAFSMMYFPETISSLPRLFAPVPLTPMVNFPFFCFESAVPHPFRPLFLQTFLPDYHFSNPVPYVPGAHRFCPSPSPFPELSHHITLPFPNIFDPPNVPIPSGTANSFRHRLMAVPFSF